MGTDTNVLSPRSQLQNHLALMSNAENNEVLRRINFMDSLDDQSGWSTMKKVISATENIFFREIFHWNIKYKEDVSRGIEEMIEKFTPQFLSFVQSLEFGTANVGPTVGLLRSLPKNFGKLKNLRKLYLNGQQIEDFEPLRSLELDFLCAEECPITDPTPVSLKRLSWFNIDQTKIENIEFLKDSELIVMQNVPGQLNDSKIDVLLKMPNLINFCLTINGRNFTQERIGHFIHKGSGIYEIVDKKEIKLRKMRAQKIYNSIIDYRYLDVL